MNKKEMVAFFLKRGVLLSPQELERLTPENYKDFLPGHEEKHAERPDREKSQPEPTQARMKKVSSVDMVKAHRERFEKLSGILMKKMDAVSIDKARKIFSKVAIIGRAKEKNSECFVLEDITGETNVISKDNFVEDGDVVGLVGFFRDNKFYPEQIIWPDVPLQNPQTAFTEELVLATGVGGPNGNTISVEARRGSVEMREHGNISVVCCCPESETNEERAVKILKSRTITNFGVMPFLLENVPNVLWFADNGRNWSRNYRGVVIISTNGKTSAVCSGDAVEFKNIINAD